MQSFPGISKEQFLQTVRQGLGRPQGPPASPYPRLTEGLPQLEEQVELARRRIAQNTGPLLDRLAEVAALRGWNVRRVADPEEAVGHIGSLATSRGIDRVARSAQAVFDRLPVDEPLRGLGVNVKVIARDNGSPQPLREEIIAAGMGLTGADYAVAETGSVIVTPRRGLSRLVSLVPPVHVAVVTPHDVVGTLDDLFLLRRWAYHRDGGHMGSYLNFITGPSRTADIEQTIVVGVHGPKEVHLVLLG